VPLYDYDCANCGRRFEVIHGVYADPPAACPLCGGGPVKKAIQAPAVHFKGSGWAKKERRATVAPGKAAAADGDSSGEKAATASGAKPAAGESASTGSDTPAAATTSTTDQSGSDAKSKPASKSAGPSDD
jgi:putative FmdB family regulatory protein